MKTFETFKQLHQNPIPLLLANIWDVNSARIFEAKGYKAIGVSSQALSNAMGYDDGENLPFEMLHQLTKRVAAVVSIPFSVDMEAGYSRTADGIIANIDKLYDAGAVGINLEDTVPGARRQFQPADTFAKTLSAIANHISRNNMQLFLNVRTDGFLLGIADALTETLARIKAYENSGADGIFVPCIANSDDIRQVVNATKLPINVMCMPALPDFDTLASLRVKRISMGPFLFNKVNTGIGELASAIVNDNSFSALF